MDPEGDQNTTHSHVQPVHKAANIHMHIHMQGFDCKDTSGLTDAVKLYNPGRCELNHAPLLQQGLSFWISLFPLSPMIFLSLWLTHTLPLYCWSWSTTIVKLETHTKVIWWKFYNISFYTKRQTGAKKNPVPSCESQWLHATKCKH